MPFTLSHAAAVLPFVRRRPLVGSALVAGSLAPDLFYFTALRPMRVPGTHTWWGTVVIDVPVGLAMWAAFHWLLAEPVLALLPRWVRARLVPITRKPRLSTAVALSVLIGAITHVALDSFTHGHGAMVELIPALRGQLWTDMPLFYFLQVAGSFIGAIILVWYGIHWLRQAQPATEIPMRYQPSRKPWLATLGVLGGATGLAVVNGIAGMARTVGTSTSAMASHIAAGGTVTSLQAEVGFVRATVGATTGLVIALICYGLGRRASRGSAAHS